MANEEDNQIQVGDTVWLKSGSEEMVVDEIGTYGGIKKALCVWHSNQQPMEKLYALTSLTKDSPYGI